jgi:hypothetical protein
LYSCKRCPTHRGLYSQRMMSFLVNSSSREVSRKASSSSEERSITEIPSEDSLCSYTGDGGQRDETSGGEASGGGDLDREGSGVEALISEDEEPLVDECECLVPLLSSIVNK